MYLLECDAAGLVPYPYDVGWRIAASFTGIKRHEYMPQFESPTKQEEEVTRMAQKATAVSQDVRFD